MLPGGEEEGERFGVTKVLHDFLLAFFFFLLFWRFIYPAKKVLHRHFPAVAARRNKEDKKKDKSFAGATPYVILDLNQVYSHPQILVTGLGKGKERAIL